jgi:hypothetical protein
MDQSNKQKLSFRVYFHFELQKRRTIGLDLSTQTHNHLPKMIWLIHSGELYSHGQVYLESGAEEFVCLKIKSQAVF